MDLSAMRQALQSMGARHVGDGTLLAHSAAVRDSLLEAMAELAGDLWNDTLRDDWTHAISAGAEAMIEGAECPWTASPPSG